MALLLAFAITLMAAVLISGLAERTVLSTAVLFLLAGLALGTWLPAAAAVHPSLLLQVAELALFAVLFTDGMRAGAWPRALGSQRLVVRALAAGMPLTIVGIALLARWLLALSWLDCFLMGAVLSPTDPVFVSAIFAFDAVPERLRRLLNVESGVNDGIALPLVVLLLGASAAQAAHLGWIGLELIGGVAIGVAIPWAGIKLESSRFFGSSQLFRPLNAFALGLLVLAVSLRLQANIFLAAFAAGVAVARISPEVRQDFERFGELVAELLKLAAILIFGMVIAPGLFDEMNWKAVLFIPLALFAVRLVAMQIALAGSRLSRGEILATGWFGPKGFASVVYGIMILDLGTGTAQFMAHLVGITIALSIFVYSSTDILVARRFEKSRARLHRLGDRDAHQG